MSIIGHLSKALVNNNIDIVSQAYLCSNCGACLAICPHEAITMQWTTMGRLYAKVGAGCTNCGLCLKACPSVGLLDKICNSYEDLIGDYRNVYIGHSLDEKIYENSQSGGIVTTIIKDLLETRTIDAAIVCKMSYGKTPIVRPTIVTNIEQLYATQKSCYTPVDMLSILKASLKYESVALVGLPCHIDGLKKIQNKCKKFLNVKYSIGLICDRTLCATVQDVVREYGNHSDNKIFNIKRNWFEKESIIIKWKGKKVERGEVKYSYRTAPLSIKYKSSKEVVVPSSVRFALKDMFTAPRCRVCSDKLNTQSDLVLGDPWGMSGVDWDRGDNVVIVRNEKGQEIINQLIDSYKVTVSRVVNVKELFEGQKIDQRRLQVCAYAAAFDELPGATSLSLRDDSIYSNSEAKRVIESKARQEYRAFVKRESLSEKQIVMDAFSLLGIYSEELLTKVVQRVKRFGIRLSRSLYRSLSLCTGRRK